MMSFSLTPSMAMSGKELTWIVTSYFLGCFTAGYYWTRWRTGKDIRALGSGNVGARNVGRVIGRSGFLITFLLDFAKGVLAVAGATYFKLGPEAMIATMFAVAAGHNWPVQLHFKGGKGIAVSLGALLAYDPFIVLCLVVIFVPVFAMIRLFTLSGMLAFTLAPLGGFLCGLEKEGVAAVSILAVLALVTHRRNIRKELARLVFHRSVEDAEMHKGPNDEV
jgi:glycerol-3-phosphate acyltransferase PlsY